MTKMDTLSVRDDFPILSRVFDGNPLIYLDNGATTQKPRKVIDAVTNFYENHNANVGRSIFNLSLEANGAYGGSRNILRKYLNAESAREIVFTRGTTESINLIANSLGEITIKEGDDIIVTAMEHHGNLCPWQALCKRKRANLKVIPINEDGDLDMDAYLGMLNERTKIVAVTHISNVLGTINPIKKIIDAAHKYDAAVVIDGAQSAGHAKIDVRALDCDFFVLSGHKMYGPMGIGLLYGKEKWLEKMPPYQTGGGIVFDVSYDEIVRLKGLPDKFEAGTPNVAGAVGLAAAANYLTELGLDKIEKAEHDLLEYATRQLSQVEGLAIYGKSKNKAGIVSFLIDGIHPYDVGNHANKSGIAMRTGVHCSIPLVDSMKLPVGTVRASFGIYNTKSEVDTLRDVLTTAKPDYWSVQKPGLRQ